MNRCNVNHQIWSKSKTFLTFAAFVRHLIFNISYGDEAWLAQLRALGFVDDTVQQLYNAAAAPFMSESVQSSYAYQYAQV